MGIQGKFTVFDEHRASRVADDMLARVLQNYTQQRVADVIEINRSIIGEVVPVRVQTSALTVVAQTLPVTLAKSFPVPIARSGAMTLTALFTAALMLRLLRHRRRSGQDDVLTFIARTLIERSPVFSGSYRDSHVLLVDGQIVASARDVAAGADVPDGKIYTFAATVPWSRKVEIGKTLSGRDFVVSVPNRIYQRTAADARGRFPDIREISFSYEPLDAGAVGSWSKGGSAGRLARRVRRGPSSRHGAWLSRQPTITVKMV